MWLTKRFDYHALEDSVRNAVIEQTDEIKHLIRRTASDIIAIGQKLLEVKAMLGHGQFGDWLFGEFDWSERTAQNFMRVAETFKSETVADLSIQTKALYLLASPKTPEAARMEAIELAASGESIGLSSAKTIVEKHTTVESGFPAPDTAFLDKFIDESTDEPKPARQPELKLSDAGVAPLHILMSVEARDRVMETLNAVKQSQGLKTHGEALIFIIDSWRAYAKI